MAQMLSGCDVLVIEEDPKDANLIAGALRSLGARVFTISSPAEAFAMLGRRRWTLAVLNYSLNSDDCRQLCDRLLENDIPFLIAAHDVVVKGSASWGLRIRRPINVAELINATGELLRGVWKQMR
jgi:DNA-binding response OmpR family regulator